MAMETNRWRRALSNHNGNEELHVFHFDHDLGAKKTKGKTIWHSMLSVCLLPGALFRLIRWSILRALLDDWEGLWRL